MLQNQVANKAAKFHQLEVIDRIIDGPKSNFIFDASSQKEKFKVNQILDFW